MKKNKVSFIILIGVGLNLFIYLFLDVCYNAHLSIDVHCNKSAKIYRFASTTASLFWYNGGAKISL